MNEFGIVIVMMSAMMTAFGVWRCAFTLASIRDAMSGTIAGSEEKETGGQS
jgi:hypothetical protein